jgi:hypothetical protein
MLGFTVVLVQANEPGCITSVSGFMINLGKALKVGETITIP